MLTGAKVSPWRVAINRGALIGGLTAAGLAVGWWLVSRGHGDMSGDPVFFTIFGLIPAFLLGALLGAVWGWARSRPTDLKK